MRNPFKYGVRVSGSSFFDRTKVKRAMLNTLESHGSRLKMTGGTSSIFIIVPLPTGNAALNFTCRHHLGPFRAKC